MMCRHCGIQLDVTFVDLGSAPPSNAYLSPRQLIEPEKWFPLKVLVCKHCWLVQTEDFTQADELFDSNYAYFSSYSSTWLKHASDYVAMIVKRFGLDAKSHVVEVAANDGYLLQYVKNRGIPCTGIEPTRSTADAARQKGIPVVEKFFGVALAKELVSEGLSADLIAANNVLAHVPDINDFVAGFAALLKVDGVATFEFPHLLNLVSSSQFDTIYHEHFSYLSLTSLVRIFASNGLNVFDVEEIPTHGGSLRVYSDRLDGASRPMKDAVTDLLVRERTAGVNCVEYYSGFQPRVNRIKNDFLRFLLGTKESGKTVGAYGAAAKGNTLLNYAGVRQDLISFVVDRNPAKQNTYLPGSRIPVVDEDHLRAVKPDYVVIFPWNLKEEISCQLEYVRTWGAKFVTAVPRLEIV